MIESDRRDSNAVDPARAAVLVSGKHTHVPKHVRTLGMNAHSCVPDHGDPITLLFPPPGAEGFLVVGATWKGADNRAAPNRGL